MRVLVFGAGSLGSLVGGLLAREHAVTLVGRDPHVTAVRRDGLRITGTIDRVVGPDAVTAVDGMTADLALVTVKAFDTDAAARALAACDLGAACSLQNGMGNEATLADRLDCPVLAGTATYGARLREPGVVECTGEGTITVGPHGGAPLELAERVGASFRAAGIETEVAADMAPRLWEKVAVNAGINPVTALARVENGAVREPPLDGIAERAAVEAAGVAREAGIDLSDADARDALRRVAADTASNTSSMWADVEAGRRTEIDAINGYVVEHADRSVPTNGLLAALVRGWERGVGLR